jgi:hypothetical protein
MTDPIDDNTGATRNSTERSESAGDDGVDITLIRWMLSLSPRERLRVVQDTAESILRLRNARRNRT